MEAFTQPYTNYTLTFKMDLLNFMIENGNETATIFKIPAPSSISVWRKNYETLKERIAKL